MWKKISRKGSIHTLLDVMAKLRSPSGCPWDRKQTEQTLKRFLLEETFEVIEAIEQRKHQSLKEELGDLLLQIVFLSRIAEEKGKFGFFDVVQTLTAKLIRRHPHVFSDGKGRPKTVAKSPGEVERIWNCAKASENKFSSSRMLLDDIPLGLPALERCHKITQRVSRVGFDWRDIGELWEKVEEELEELKEAIGKKRRKRIEEEIGDVLFTLVNLSRFVNISAEEALRKANRRFIHRFNRIEKELRKQGKTLNESSLEEMDLIWNAAKKAERHCAKRKSRKH